MGKKYVESEAIELSQSYEESSSMTPIFFILSPGEVESLGKELGFTCNNQKLHNVSLGQGQEKVAEVALKTAATKGHWVILQVVSISDEIWFGLATCSILNIFLAYLNIHLVRSWLPRLEKKLDQNAVSAHTDYRVFMSAEPANKPENHILPQVNRTEQSRIVN
ncbi:hypothetical protein Avbf_01550 [Armadillidium vulgare]|nr:hypothetical protein Avbf_01550 [Armadillidium vulgare]